MMKTMLSVLVVGLLLGGCASEEKSAETLQSQAATEGTTEVSTPKQQHSILTSKLQTTFSPQVTELIELTPADEEKYQLIIERLNAIDGPISDREVVYEIAAEQGQEPEAYWEHWLDIVDVKMHGNGAHKTTILTADLVVLFEEFIETNIVGEMIESNDVLFSDLKNHRVTYTTSLKVDRTFYKIEVHFQFSNDLSEAEVVELLIDDNPIAL